MVQLHLSQLMAPPLGRFCYARGMKLVDANTGIEPKIGQTFRNVLGYVTVLKVKEGIFRAKALVDVNGERHWWPLTVRYLHPGFPFQKVGFLNS